MRCARATAAVAVLALVVPALARADDDGLLGQKHFAEVGVLVGPYSELKTGAPGPLNTTLVAARVHAASVSQRTMLGFVGGAEFNAAFGRGLGDAGFWWGQLDLLSNLVLFQVGLGPVNVRAVAIAGFGASVWSGFTFVGGGRVMLGVADKVSLEATYLLLPTKSGNLVTHAQATLEIGPIALSLERRQGSTEPGQQVDSIFGVASMRF